ncbi:hypothetical protein Btru_052559 [Bulinus truncatus]|nr:hypothetical protein Btru_052559 [Bulinus truncatus]
MKTYFLLGSCHNPLTEPQDEHVRLALVIPSSEELNHHLTQLYQQHTNGYIVDPTDHSPTKINNNLVTKNSKTTSGLPSNSCPAGEHAVMTDNSSSLGTNGCSGSRTSLRLKSLNPTVNHNDSLAKSISSSRRSSKALTYVGACRLPQKAELNECLMSQPST